MPTWYKDHLTVATEAYDARGGLWGQGLVGMLHRGQTAFIRLNLSSGLEKAALGVAYARFEVLYFVFGRHHLQGDLLGLFAHRVAFLLEIGRGGT